MKKLKEKLQERLTELCHEHYAGKIRVNPRGLTHSEWFDLRKVPFVDLVDFLDSEIVNEDMFKYGHPKNWECQLVVKI